MADTNTNTTTQATVETPHALAPAAQATASAKPEDIASALLNALDARTQRAERSVAKSFGEQYGMTEDEINTILTEAKAKKATAIPAEIQKRIDEKEKELNNRLIIADIKSKGAEMGLVDADVAMQLIGDGKIEVDEKSGVKGTEEALKALKESKPYLFTAQPTGDNATVGAKINTNANEHTFTLAEISKMSRDEINANLDKIFKQREIK